MLGEFGGLGLAVDGHTWAEQTWGYKGTKDFEALTRGYEKLLAKAWELKEKAGLSRRDLHANHRRGDRRQRPADL